MIKTASFNKITKIYSKDNHSTIELSKNELINSSDYFGLFETEPDIQTFFTVA